MEQRVLSINSHVVHGYVGNKAATLPLQLLGLDVDPLLTVHFSNHTGYAVFDGFRTSAAQFDAVAHGLRDNELLARYDHVLTGYVGQAEVLRRSLALVGEINAARQRAGAPAMRYVCDPVMGDNGKMYVPAELTAIYRDEAMPLAALTTPNAFELELLSGRPVRCVDDARSACTALHARGVRQVVVTSIDADDRIDVVGSDALRSEQFAFSIPRVRAYYSGTGDLMSALLLAHTANASYTLEGAVRRACASIQGVLRDTHAAATAGASSSAPARPFELRLVQSAQHIVRPPALVLFE